MLSNTETYSETKENTKDNTVEHDYKVCVIDGMAMFQEMGKPLSVNTFQDLATHFLVRLAVKTKAHSEMHLVFDQYDVFENNNKREKTGWW